MCSASRLSRWTAENFPVEGGIEDKGIFLSSDVPISVNVAYVDTYFIPQSHNDATVIPLVSPSQTAFHIVNHIDALYVCNAVFRNDFFAISASQDGTIVTVSSPTFASSFDLNRHQTYSQIAENNEIELSGVKITASAPVTVVSGNLCTYNYVGPSTLGTYITGQRPVDQYGTQYVVPAIKAPRNSGYDVHVIASLDNTHVDIDGQQVLLNEDERFVQAFPSKINETLVTCSLPCNVVQFTKGYHNYDGMFGIDVTPTNEFYHDALFSTSEEDVDHHITVVVDSPTAVGDILLDGALFDPTWSAPGDVIYATADVGKGSHVMSSTESRFTVYVYAHGGSTGGGYGFAVLPAGTYLTHRHYDRVNGMYSTERSGPASIISLSICTEKCSECIFTEKRSECIFTWRNFMYMYGKAFSIQLHTSIKT